MHDVCVDNFIKDYGVNDDVIDDDYRLVDSLEEVVKEDIGRHVHSLGHNQDDVRRTVSEDV